MEKEISLMNYDAYTLKMMNLQDKIIVSFLSCLLPIFAIIETYRYLSGYGYYWLALAVIFLIIALNAYFWNSKTFSLNILIQFILAGGIVGTHVFLSMTKGIELLSGPQEGTFFSFPIQQGLINLRDITIAGCILLYAVVMLSYLIFKRREVNVVKIFKK